VSGEKLNRKGNLIKKMKASEEKVMDGIFTFEQGVLKTKALKPNNDVKVEII
jgi:hypothetical protein